MPLVPSCLLRRWPPSVPCVSPVYSLSHSIPFVSPIHTIPPREQSLEEPPLAHALNRKPTARAARSRVRPPWGPARPFFGADASDHRTNLANLVLHFHSRLRAG